MKISGRKPVSGPSPVGGVPRVPRADKAQTPPVEKATDVEISSSSREVTKARAVLAAFPDVRVEKVAEIKPLVDEGSYKVESQVVAKKMVDTSLRESARADKRAE